MLINETMGIEREKKTLLARKYELGGAFGLFLFNKCQGQGHALKEMNTGKNMGCTYKEMNKFVWTKRKKTPKK